MILNRTPKLPLNPVQLHLLQLFSWCHDEKELDELKSVLLQYYQKKVDEGIDTICQEKGIDQKAVEEMLNAHYRIHSQS